MTLNVSLWFAAPGLALRKAIVTQLFGPSMVRAEVHREERARLEPRPRRHHQGEQHAAHAAGGRRPHPADPALRHDQGHPPRTPPPARARSRALARGRDVAGDRRRRRRSTSRRIPADAQQGHRLIAPVRTYPEAVTARATGAPSSSSRTTTRSAVSSSSTSSSRTAGASLWRRTGEEAIAELRGQPVRLVVLDIGLPGMDGFEVCRRIRAGSKVPIVMLTARDEEPDRVAGLELGADDYVSKPFSPRELVGADQGDPPPLRAAGTRTRCSPRARSSCGATPTR